MAKPSRTGISLEDLQKYAAELGEYAPIDDLLSDTRVLEKLEETGRISFLERVLTEIYIYTSALDSGLISIEEYNYYKSIAKEEDVLVPASYMRAIGEAWREYLEAPTGTSLGEAFALEGRGQGKQKARDKLQRIVKDIRLTRAVLLYRSRCEQIGQPVSVKSACADVAEHFENQGKGYRAGALEEAYKKYHQLVWDMMSLGTTGGETS